MATMNVSLPEAIKAWVERQAESGQYGDAQGSRNRLPTPFRTALHMMG